MKRRVMVSLILSSVVFSAIVGCSQSTPTPSSGETSKKVLTMVTSPDYPPYEFYETGSRQIVGFDIDIAKAITSELGYELKINESDFNGLVPALQANRADFVMAGMTPTPERQRNVDFSTIYYEAKNTIVATKASNLKVTKDLSGKTVGVQLGSIQAGDAEEIAKKVPNITVKQLNKVPDLIQEIKAGRIDAAIVEDTVAKGFTDSNPQLMFSPIPSEGPSGSAIAFPKGSPLVADFNKVLAKLKASGELEKLASKWFSQSVPPSPTPSPSK